MICRADGQRVLVCMCRSIDIVVVVEKERSKLYLCL